MMFIRFYILNPRCWWFVVVSIVTTLRTLRRKKWLKCLIEIIERVVNSTEKFQSLVELHWVTIVVLLKFICLLKQTRVVNLKLYWQHDAAWWFIEQQTINEHDSVTSSSKLFLLLLQQFFSSRLFSATFSSLLIIQSHPNMIELLTSIIVP